MKKDLLWCLALLLMSLVFNSCDEEEVINEKVLQSTCYINRNNDTYLILDFIYDEKGRIVNQINRCPLENSSFVDTLTMNFSDNSFYGKAFRTGDLPYVKEKSGEINQQGYITQLEEKGLFMLDTNDPNDITVNGDGSYIIYRKYNYNNFGQISSYNDDFEDIKTNESYVWEDGNIVEVLNNGSKTLIYTYENKDDTYINKGHLHFTSLFENPDASYGIANKYLPTSFYEIFGNGDSNKYDISYIFDEDGYPLIISWDGFTRTFVWKNK